MSRNHFEPRIALKLTIIGIDRLIEPLKTTCTNKVKANAVKQEFEKQDELKRSALRAFLALLAVSDAGKLMISNACRHFINQTCFTDKHFQMTSFLETIKQNSELKVLFDQIQKDNTNGDVSSPMEI